MLFNLCGHDESDVRLFGIVWRAVSADGSWSLASTPQPGWEQCFDVAYVRYEKLIIAQFADDPRVRAVDVVRCGKCKQVWLPPSVEAW